MGAKVGKRVAEKVAARLIAAPGTVVDESYMATHFGLKAFRVEGGQYLTQLTDDGRWALWPSFASYKALMDSVVTGRESDPVTDAVGDPDAFVAATPALARELLETSGVSGNAQLVDGLAIVDDRVRSRSGSYWVEDQGRLRMLIAFLGELLREQSGAGWLRDAADGVVVVSASGKILRVGRLVVSMAKEARKGEFSLGEVMEELLGPRPDPHSGN